MEKVFFDLPVKNKEETYEKIIEMSNDNDYTTGNLLDFAYFKGNYKLIAIDLSKQTKLKDPQQINFIGRLDKDNGATSLCDYSDAYILVTGNITVVGPNDNTKVAFKNCAPFRKCRTNK